MAPAALSAASLVALLLGPLSVSYARWAHDPFDAMAALRVEPPSPAPDGAFTTLDGRPVRLRDLRGKPILLGFFTTW